MTIANARPSTAVEIAWPRPAEFQLSGTVVQYRVRGTTAWIPLFDLGQITGATDAAVLNALEARGFSLDGNGVLHFTPEEQARAAADQALGNSISAETTRARAAEQAEQTRAQAAEQAETSRATGVEGALQGRSVKLETRSQATASATYSQVLADAKGQVAGGWDWDRRFISDTARPDFDVYTRLVNGARRAFVYAPDIGREVDISSGEFDDVVAAYPGGAWAYWTGRTGNGLPVRREAWLRPSYVFAAGVDTLIPVIVYGQSLAAGAASFSQYNGVFTVETPDPLVATGRSAVFVGGARTLGHEHDDPTEALDGRNIRDLMDARERLDIYSGQTVATTAGAAFAGLAPTNYAIGFSNAAIGSQTYEALQQGTTPYQNLLMQARRWVQIARLKGLSVPQIIVFWRQGESNAGDTEAAYRTKMLALSSALTADIGRLTGQTTPVRIITDQISVFPGPIIGPTAAALSLARDYPAQFTCVEPKYEYSYADGLHINGMGQAMSGAKLGRVLKSILIDGINPLPLYCASAVRSGNVVRLTFAGGDGSNLAIDNVGVADPGGTRPRGIEFTDDAGSATAAAVGISGARTVDVTLSGTPTGANPRIGIAASSTVPGNNGGPTTGPRCCIAETTLTPVTVRATTIQQRNRASHQTIAVS